MPSFLELLQSSSDGEPSSSASGVAPLDVLASVKTEGGRRRRRRHRRNLAVSGLGLVALALPALALVGGDDPEEVQSVDVASQPDTEPDAPPVADDKQGMASTSTTVATEVAGVVIERTPEEAAADDEPATTPTTSRPRTTTPPTTTAPPLVCSNSYDPACGNSSWSPAPGPNSPITASAPTGLTVSRDGGTVTFEVVWTDPDAIPNYTDDDTDGTLITAGCATEAQRYGPWTPPAANGGSTTRTVTSAAPPGAVAGDTYEVTVYGSSRNGDCLYDVYGSEGQIRVSILVTEAPTS